jgi:hypothetical protein
MVMIIQRFYRPDSESIPHSEMGKCCFKVGNGKLRPCSNARSATTSVGSVRPILASRGTVRTPVPAAQPAHRAHGAIGMMMRPAHAGRVFGRDR